jgi:hypothetical protein
MLLEVYGVLYVLCASTQVYTAGSISSSSGISSTTQVCTTYLIGQLLWCTLTHVLIATNIHASDAASAKYCVTVVTAIALTQHRINSMTIHYHKYMKTA